MNSALHRDLAALLAEVNDELDPVKHAALRKRVEDAVAVLVTDTSAVVPTTLLDKKYSGESIVDVDRDVSEAFQADFTPQVNDIPTDEYNIQKGRFHVQITWLPEEIE